MNIDYKLIGYRIKKYRLDKKISQQKLAEILDVSNVYVSKIERGVTKVNLETLYKISTILEVDLNLIITGIDKDASDYLEVELLEMLQQCSPERKKKILEIVKSLIDF